jgi:hypothetical protein
MTVGVVPPMIILMDVREDITLRAGPRAALSP